MRAVRASGAISRRVESQLRDYAGSVGAVTGRRRPPGRHRREPSGRARARGDRTCNGATYTRRALSVETFAEAYRVTPQQLSLSGDPIALVDVTCESGGLELGSTLVLKSDTAMLTMWDGVFYVLTRS